MKRRLVGTALALSLCQSFAASATGRAEPGAVRFLRVTNTASNRYTDSPPPDLQKWMRDHFWRIVTYSPYFDGRLSWYPNGWVYLDSYAIYTDSSLVTQHPEWILKDSKGQKLYIPFDCSRGTCTQYAADIASASFRQWWIGRAEEVLSKRYKGLFIDDVNMEFRIGNGTGAFVSPIDSKTHGEMTWEDWRRYMADFVAQIRSALPDTEIVHNSIWFAGPPNVRDREPHIQRQIAAADYLCIEFGVNDSGLTGGDGQWSLNSMLGYIDRIHAAGKGVIIDGVPSEPAGREYALAAYYLISNGSDVMSEKTAGPDNWWKGYETNLGTPAGPRTVWNGLLRRDYSGGMTLLNPPGGSAITVSLPAKFRRLDGTPASSVTLRPTQGVVLRGLN